MSKKYFYHHLIEIESLIVELDNLELSVDEKKHLANLIDSSLHHKILDVILSELSEKDKEVFIDHLKSEENEKIWEFLNSRIERIEDKVKDTARDLKERMHKDVEEAKQVARVKSRESSGG